MRLSLRKTTVAASRWVSVALALAAWLAAGGAPAAEGKKYALLVGISNYQYGTTIDGVTPLKYAGKDAETLESFLRDEYDEIITLVDKDAEHEDLMIALKRLRGLLTGDDTILVFMSGHGFRDPTNGQTYWITYDTRLEVLDDRAIRLTHLLQYVRELKARRKVVLLDHCFSGDVAPPPQPLSGNLSKAPGALPQAGVPVRKGLVPESLATSIREASRGMVVLAASKNEAWESDTLQQGVFTSAVLNALKTNRADANTDGYLQITELMKFLIDEVEDLAENPQDVVNVVEEAVNLADWVFAKLPADFAEAAQEKSELSEILVEWRRKNYINAYTLLRSSEALDSWVESLSNGELPDPIDVRIVKEIRDHADLVAGIDDPDPAERERQIETITKLLEDLLEDLG